jgi:hypothetical protein
MRQYVALVLAGALQTKRDVSTFLQSSAEFGVAMRLRIEQIGIAER